MDSSKCFGKTVEDLTKVFNEAPDAKFVLDINHIYTNDRTMELAKDFQKQFQSKLSHYHISSSNGESHDCFVNIPEDKILHAISDLSKPMIHEGDVLKKMILDEELGYIRKTLKQEE